MWGDVRFWAVLTFFYDVGSWIVFFFRVWRSIVAYDLYVGRPSTLDFDLIVVRRLLLFGLVVVWRRLIVFFYLVVGRHSSVL